MELYQLKAFAAVAEHGNVTRAAEALFTSQPAVSAQIKALEQTFGVALFNRTPAGMTLTEPGHKLLGHPRATLAQARATEDLAKHLRDGTAGQLRIGLNDAGPRLRVDVLSRALLADHPEISLDFTNTTSGDVLAGVRRYDFDAGFCEGPVKDPAVAAVKLADVDLCIVLPVGWHAEDWHELAQYPWVFTSPGCSYNGELSRIAKSQGIKPQKQFRLDHDSTSLTMVREGLAVSMVDRNFAQPFLDAGQLAVWPGYEGRIPLSAIYLAKRHAEPPITAFLAAVTRVFEDQPIGA